VARLKCEQDHLFFARYFFRSRQGIKFIVNWHHQLMADIVDDVIAGRKQNVVIEVSPGSSKTELVVINLIARGLAINPRARFLHLSGSDTLASLNSSTARDIVLSDEYQQLWPMKIAEDAKSKKRWNVLVNGQLAGGVYATALGGQVTGFRAGHMAPGFQGAILIDDPIKPEDAFSRSKVDAANRKLLTTVKSRKANPDTPIILIMQRLAEKDPAGFIRAGNLQGRWDVVRIPAVLAEADVASLAAKYQELIKPSETIDGRFSYWPYKEPIGQLLAMERGDGTDQSGARISRHVFSSQYQQAPIALGGNIIKGEHFERYTVTPKMKWRKVYADTAQKTKERNDYSVFEEWGMGVDGRAYLLDLIRGKWEAPELQKRALAFWSKCKARDVEHFGQCRKLAVEDKSSGTGLIQTLKLPPHNIPIEAIVRKSGGMVDKVTRVMDALPYIEARQVCIPEDAPFTNDFVTECEAFTADDSHDFDDQIDPCIDAVDDMLQSGNKMKQWEALAPEEKRLEPQEQKTIAQTRAALLSRLQK
jgi:predicted phage terminase large subunit-like protein